MMRDVRKAGSEVRLRLAAAEHGWERERAFLDEGNPLVLWRHRDGASYTTADDRVLPEPLASQVRALAIAFMAERCPCCGAAATWAEGVPTQEELEGVQLLPVYLVAAGMALSAGSEGLKRAIPHHPVCGARPSAIVRTAQSGNN